MARNRPLCTFCLFFFLLYGSAIFLFGRWFLPDLQISPLEELPDGRFVTLQGTLEKWEEKDDYHLLFLSDVRIRSSQKSLREQHILIYDKGKGDYHLGDILSVKGTVGFFSCARNPGGFDRNLYYRKQGIHGYVWANRVSSEEGYQKLQDNIRDDSLAGDGQKSTDQNGDVLGINEKTEQMNRQRFMYTLKEQLYHLRHTLSEGVFSVMGPEYGSVLTAMLLGEKSEMDEETKSLYQRNGIAHILAISGLHLSFLGTGVYEFLRKKTGRAGFAGAVAVSFLSVYLLLVGLSVSAIRAFVMLLFRIGAQLAKRTYDAATALAFSAVICLLYQPLCILDAAFWFSFGSILAMLLIRPAFQDLPFPALWTGISLNIVLLPITLRAYSEIPLYGMFLNLLVIPLLGILFFCGILGLVCLLLFRPAAILSLGVCKCILGIFSVSCKVLERLPFARLILGKPTLLQIVFYYGVLAVCIRQLHKGSPMRIPLKDIHLLHAKHPFGDETYPVGHCRFSRMKRAASERNHPVSGVDYPAEDRNRVASGKRETALVWITCSLLLFLGVIILTAHPHLPGRLEITALDVEQGDCFFIRDPGGNTYLIDGGSSTKESVGKYTIVPCLKAMGISDIDYVFLTHGDGDHTSGIQEMLEDESLGIRIRNLILPTEKFQDDMLGELRALAEKRKIPVRSMRAGDCIREKSIFGREFTLECLQPAETFTGKAGNEASLVLSLTYGGNAIEEKEEGGAAKKGAEKGKTEKVFRMLFTGDTEGEGEKHLIKVLRENALADYDVLKVAHHGSKNSTSEELLQAVKPKAAIISVGEKNRYGHPAEETMERLAQCGAMTICTKDGGAVFLEVDRDAEFRIRQYDPVIPVGGFR